VEADYLAEVDSELWDGLNTDLPIRTEDALINDCIIELSAESHWDLSLFLAETDRIGVKFLEIRFLDFEAFTRFHSTIQLALERHSIEFLHFIVPFDPELHRIILDEMTAFHRLDQLTVYRASSEITFGDFPFRVHFSTQSSIDYTQCGCVDPAYFGYNVLSYYSNRKYNSCLSHKLSIDQFGEIRNCPSKKESFGKLADIDLERTIQLAAFQKEWHITKASILICSDCEFRWMCSDCRVFIWDESNLLSKPSKCGYNPYINKWINEEGYLPEDQCGVSIQGNQLNVDVAKLNQLNTKIWA